MNISHERLFVLNIACTDGFVTNEGLRSILNIHKVEIADLLKDMCKSNLLIAEGYDKESNLVTCNSNQAIAENEQKSNQAHSESNLFTHNSNQVIAENEKKSNQAG